MGYGEEDFVSVDKRVKKPKFPFIAIKEPFRTRAIQAFAADVALVSQTILGISPREKHDVNVMLSSLEIDENMKRDSVLRILYTLVKILHKAAKLQPDGMLTHKQQNEIEALLRGTFLVHMIYPRKGVRWVKTQNVVVNVASGKKGRVVAIDTPGLVDMAKNSRGFIWDKFENHQKINRFLGGGIFRRLFVKPDLKDSENPLFYPAKVIVGNGK